jgi:hypothetical protein
MKRQTIITFSMADNLFVKVRNESKNRSAAVTINSHFTSLLYILYFLNLFCQAVNLS